MTEAKRPLCLQTEPLHHSTRRCTTPNDSDSKNFHSSNSDPNPDSPSLILPYLYVGDQAQTQIDTISNLDISYILSLQSLPKFLSTSAQSENPPVGRAVEVDSEGELLPRANSSKDYLVKIKATDHKDCAKANGNKDTDLAEPICVRKDVKKLKHEHKPWRSSNISEPHDKRNDVHQQEKSQTDAQQESCSSKALLGRCNQLGSSVQRLIRGKCINISDTFEQLLDKFFDETHNFIEEARRNKCNILVHCKAGISRSPTIAIAYLMKWKRLHLQEAYNFVKRCRPQISPNLNFMGQLVSYERQLRCNKPPLPLPTTCCLPSPNQADSLSNSEEVNMVCQTDKQLVS